MPFAVLAPGGQSENVWIHPRTFFDCSNMGPKNAQGTDVVCLRCAVLCRNRGLTMQKKLNFSTSNYILIQSARMSNICMRSWYIPVTLVAL